MENYSYFAKESCPNCGANIVIDQSKCPYCNTELEFVWKLSPEKEAELYRYLEKLESDLPRFHMLRYKKIYNLLIIIYEKIKRTENLETSNYEFCIMLARRINHVLRFFDYFIYLMIAPIVSIFIFQSILHFLFFLSLSILFSITIAMFAYEQEFYSRKELISSVKKELLPELMNVLKRYNLGWSDLDQLIVKKFMLQDHSSHSFITNIVYINDRNKL
ncbi:MAG: zinc ribbon domain-containing protein [Leptospiraceae bacterium]|nr:zinc ribbon domain-containing protein [Leptospiraceae bacterium]